MKIDIDDDFVDNIVLAVLVDHYKMNEDFIKQLEEKGELKSFEQEDLEHDYKTRRHMDFVIRYFGGENYDKHKEK